MKTIFKKTTYLGFDGILYPAKAELTIEDDGTRYISLYDYYDAGNWINTEERDWTEEEINYLFKTKEKKMNEDVVGIKETTELLDAVDELVEEVKEKSEDGKLSIMEIAGSIPEVVNVVKEANDLDQIKEELKELSREELEAIAMKSIGIVFGVAGIVKNLT